MGFPLRHANNGTSDTNQLQVSRLSPNGQFQFTQLMIVVFEHSSLVSRKPTSSLRISRSCTWPWMSTVDWDLLRQSALIRLRKSQACFCIRSLRYVDNPVLRSSILIKCQIRITAAETLWILTQEDALKLQDWSLPSKSLKSAVDDIKKRQVFVADA